VNEDRKSSSVVSLESVRHPSVRSAGYVRDDQASGSFVFDTVLERMQRVALVSSEIFGRTSTTLDDWLTGSRALVVVSPTVNKLYGQLISAYFEEKIPNSELMVLDVSERTKSIDVAIQVCERADLIGLGRTEPMIAIGGGVVSDVCGVAAALYRRGVPRINIPTTLVGLIDAGIGCKTAVNHGGRKSAIGAFHPAEKVILFQGFLATLPQRHLSNGIAEITKLAVVRDAALFALLETNTVELLENGFQEPADAATTLLTRSVHGMLEELADNPFEQHHYRRKVDFGHTFSPHWEVVSGHSILHGEAVALDIALSTSLATLLGCLTEEAHDRILSVLVAAGLNVVWRHTDTEALCDSLESVVAQRDGNLHLVVPSEIGKCLFLERDVVSRRLVSEALKRLEAFSMRARLESDRS